EYMLRNTIYTAFTVPDATIFTVYALLTDPAFQKRVTKTLEDENLQHFWQNEFGKAGNYQVVKMVSGVTAKIGRFLFSPIAKRILEQPHSTINFDDILNSGKILLCNLSEGKLGEDTSQLLGTTIIAKIQLAAMHRSRLELKNRTPFYLFIDEFQNFATSSFTKLLSGGRKFGLRLTIAEQSTSQQEDRNIVNVILANTGTVICFRTASPVDEELMLGQFAPYVEKGNIPSLPRFKFYMKLSALEPEEPFSGKTLPTVQDQNLGELQRFIAASRKNWAIQYVQPAQKKKAKGITKATEKKQTSPEVSDLNTLTK
ncbi:MAG: type IV secretory system conjugative DNA transfer family protein, partial [Candidatus Woesebacteria bacterium]